MQPGVSIIIPTYNGGNLFAQCLAAIKEQDYAGKVQLIVVDSGSSDGTAEIAEQAGALVKKIDKQNFHHARTRNEALSLAKFDYVVYIVQDAVPCTNAWLSEMLRSLERYQVTALYPRQIPHDDASVFARLEMEMHSIHLGDQPSIPKLSSLQAFEALPYTEAFRTIRWDNVCALYRRETLDALPFPEVDFGEDLAWALQSFLQGNRIMYEPGVEVRHSHNRAPEYTLKRQFVNSVWRARILGRVKEDLSFLQLRDLIVLAWGIHELSLELCRKYGGRHFRPTQGAETPLLDLIWGRKGYPLTVRTHLLQPFGIRDPLEMELKKAAVEWAAMEEMETLFSRAMEAYQPNFMERTDLRRQLEARVIGWLLGEVVASHRLRGAPPEELEVFGAPVANGV